MEKLAIRRWLDSIRALDVLDWRLVEQPSDQYPRGRWECLLEWPNGMETWSLAPCDVLP